MVNSRDVARHAGVSQATVSRVLSNNSSVTPETRKRVEEASRHLGYEPNVAARAMRTNRTGTIGVVVSRITNPFYPEILQALSTELDLIGSRMIVWDAQGSGEKSASEAVRQRLVDGLIFTTATADCEPLQEALASRSPVILVNRTLEGADCSQIESASVDGACCVVSYFAKYGHTNISMIGGIEGVSTADKRLAGFQKGLREVGLEWSESRISRADFTHDDAERAFLEIMKQNNPPTALFCVNDVTAFGALDGARKMGIRVPEDLWVVGYDDIVMSSWKAFDLTTIRQPIKEMAHMAIELLRARIAGEAGEPKLYQVPAELIVRGSTAGQPWPEG